MSELPEEILQLIFSHLQGRDEGKQHPRQIDARTTLYNACLASKTVHRAALPYLYHHVNLRDPESSFDRRLRAFMLAVVRRPRLRKLVREIRTGHAQNATEVESHGRARPPISEYDLTDVQAAIEALHLAVSLKDRLVKEFSGGCQDAELALVLGLCQGLESLDLTTYYELDRSTCAAIARYAASDVQSGVLQRLRALKISHGDTEMNCGVNDLRDLLSLPGLCSFTGHMIGCDGHQTGWLPQMPRLTWIQLQDSLFDDAGAEALLSRCPEIGTLIVHWGHSMVGGSVIDFGEIGNTLRRHGKNLKHLTFRPHNALEVTPHRTVLPSLKTLESLRLLRLPLDVLFTSPIGDDEQWLAARLPHSLSKLILERPRYHASFDNGAGADGDDGDDSDEEERGVKAVDKQLVAVMCDSTFANFKLIRIERPDEFTMDVSDIGWDEGETNDFWVVLKKLRGPW